MGKESSGLMAAYCISFFSTAVFFMMVLKTQRSDPVATGFYDITHSLKI